MRPKELKCVYQRITILLGDCPSLRPNKASRARVHNRSWIKKIIGAVESMSTSSLCFDGNDDAEIFFKNRTIFGAEKYRLPHFSRTTFGIMCVCCIPAKWILQADSLKIVTLKSHLDSVFNIPPKCYPVKLWLHLIWQNVLGYWPRLTISNFWATLI